MWYQEIPTLPPMPMCEQLPLERISPRPTLQHTQESGSLEALADSIRRYGLLRPVIVRQSSPGKYAIVSGNRRLMACRMLGMSCIGVRLLREDARWQPPDRLLEALMMQRMHYLEEADALRALHVMHHMTWEELAQMLGRPSGQLRRLAELTGLQDELKALLMEEGAPDGIAMVLLSLTMQEARLEVARRIMREQLCIRDAALLVAAERRRCRNGVIKRDESLQEAMQYKQKEVWNREEMRERRGQRVISVIRDHRLYLNAIRDIAGQMKAAGFRTTVDERRCDGQTELVIRVPTRNRRAARYQSM